MSLTVRIKKKLDHFILDVDFEINGDITGFLGASGCGKSMTLKCIAGIETPDSGIITLNGRVLFDSEQKINLPPQERRVGYLFQSYALFPNMTVYQNIAMGLRCNGKNCTDLTQDKINVYGLQGLEDKKPHQLSGGQQQRVALARLMANEPDMIMLDEPFSALDSHLKWKMEQEIIRALSTYQGTVIIVSHNRSEIYRICETVAVFSNGLIEEHGVLSELFQTPKTVAGATLTGCKNISRAIRLDDYHIEAIDWGTVIESDDVIPSDCDHIGIRAHYLKFSDPNDSQTNRLSVKLVQVIENPFSTIIMLVNRSLTDITERSLIRYEMQQSLWISHQEEELELVFPKDAILFLKSSA